MNDDDDPVPLKAGVEAAPELVRALHALDSLRPDAARRARVGERLATELASARHTRLNSSWLWATVVQLAGLAIGLSALTWLAYWIAR